MEYPRDRNCLVLRIFFWNISGTNVFVAAVAFDSGYILVTTLYKAVIDFSIQAWIIIQIGFKQ